MNLPNESGLWLAAGDVWSPQDRIWKTCSVAEPGNLYLVQVKGVAPCLSIAGIVSAFTLTKSEVILQGGKVKFVGNWKPLTFLSRLNDALLDTATEQLNV